MSPITILMSSKNIVNINLSHRNIGTVLNIVRVSDVRAVREMVLKKYAMV